MFLVQNVFSKGGTVFHSADYFLLAKKNLTSKNIRIQRKIQDHLFRAPGGYIRNLGFESAGIFDSGFLIHSAYLGCCFTLC